MDELGHLGWVAHHSFEVEGLLFGIRTDSKPLARWLFRNLPVQRVRDEESMPNYSIVVGDNEDGFGKRFHVVYRDSTPIVRTRDVIEVVGGLLADIETLTFRQRRDALYLHATFLAADGVNGLFPEELVGSFETIKRRVQSLDIRLPQSRHVALDLDTLEALPRRCALEVPEEAVAELAATIGSERATWPRAELDRRTTIDVVCTMAPTGLEPVRPVSRAWALYVLAGLTPNLGELGRVGLEALRRLVGQALCWEIPSKSPRDMAETVRDILQTVGSDPLGVPAEGRG